MSYVGDELVVSFVEDCRDHLAHIEQDLLDLEAAGKGADGSLVNSVFRAAHSIKGGAGMLGFNNIKTLAHKLENVLHMIRSDELDPSQEVVDTLLKGFDRLLTLVESVDQSDSMSIDEALQPLTLLISPDSPEAASPAGADIRLDSGSVFTVDAVSLEQARRGGNNIFLIEYDLIHDIHLRDSYPLEVFTDLEKSGRVLDCQLDFAAVGSLEGDFGNRIPFYVLFATILEADLVSTVTRVALERIRNLETALESGAVQVVDKQAEFGPYVLLGDEQTSVLRFPQSATLDNAQHLRSALLQGLAGNRRLQLDLEEVSEMDFHSLQLLCAALKHHGGDAGNVVREGGVSPELRKQARELGLLAEPGKGVEPLFSE
ncbi:Hpt domain-containing protein [Paucidesulfovibrio longus]|uniref:Hpt domain-containing protein n=1 Tax=Paucidesulfovibrio longus TaxID=889 RepID=UPI0003B52BCD|nr:STAS domain-containing protein [Paucidesulfovibrio longus]